MDLGLAEWVVLAVVDEHPTHGFAVATLTGRDGELGRVWRIPRPVVYRALSRLTEAGLVAPSGVESGPGPQRTPFVTTARGHDDVDRWLEAPVSHVRDLRSQFLLKLALHDRRGSDPRGLIARQRAMLVPIAEALTEDRSTSSGFDDVLLAWRQSTTSAVLMFLDGLTDRTEPVPHQARRR